MLSIIPTVSTIFMRVCSADYILHYLHVTAAQLYSLSSLTSVGWTACAGTINVWNSKNLWGSSMHVFADSEFKVV